MSSDEEDTRGVQIEIGQSKVKDIKQKKREEELAKDIRGEQVFNWDTLGGGIKADDGTTIPASSGATGGAAKREEKPHPDGKGGFARDLKKPVPSASEAPQFQKDGITFSKGRPTFKKSEQVTAKGEFPELGVQEKKSETQTKAAIGGAIGQVSAPARGARTTNTFSALGEEDRKKPAVVEEPKSDAPKERPRFTGSLKGLLNK